MSGVWGRRDVLERVLEVKHVIFAIAVAVSVASLPTAASGRVLETELSTEEKVDLAEKTLAELGMATNSAQRRCAIEELFLLADFIPEELTLDLLPALDDPSTEVRLLTTLVLLRVDRSITEARPALENNLRSADSKLILVSLIALYDELPKLDAASDLDRVDPLVSYLLNKIRSHSSDFRSPSISKDIWGHFQSAYKAYPTELVQIVAEFVARLTHPQIKTILELTTAAVDQKNVVAHRARIALRGIYEEIPSVADDLARIAASEITPRRRSLAIRSLILMDASKTPAIGNAITQGVQSELPTIQRAALEGASKFGIPIDVSRLTDLIKGDGAAWREAALALAEIDRASLEDLAVQIRDEDPDKSLELKKILLRSRL